MDISSLSITLPVAVSLVGCFIGVMTFLGNKKKDNKKDVETEATKRSELEARLTSMEKDIQYIRLMVDKIDKSYDNHETRIQVLEKECQRKHK